MLIRPAITSHAYLLQAYQSCVMYELTAQHFPAVSRNQHLHWPRPVTTQ
jgi:hypothetical protein